MSHSPEGEPIHRRLRVAVAFGGRSGEHEVSLQSARAVMDALEQAGHEVVPIGITRQGRWLVAGDPLAGAGLRRRRQRASRRRCCPSLATPA